MIIVSILIGLGCGACALLPGWNIALSILISSLFPSSLVFTVVSYYVIKSVPESYITSAVSGTFSIAEGINSVVKPQQLLRHLMWWKVVVIIVGIIIGSFAPALMTGGSFLSVIVALIVLVRGGQSGNWFGVLTWLLIIVLVNKLLYFMGISYPISIIGIAFFGIGQSFTAQHSINKGQQDVNLMPDFVLISMATIMSMVNAGISPQAVTNLFGDYNKVTKYMASILVEVLIEAFAIGQLLQGYSLGKALSGVYIAVELVNPTVLVTALVVAGAAMYLAYFLLPFTVVLYKSDRGARLISLCISVFTLALLAGGWAFVIVPVAILLQFTVFPALELTEKEYGLTFLGLV